VYTYIFIYAFAHTYIYIYINMYNEPSNLLTHKRREYLRVYVYTDLCIYTYIHMYVCIYINKQRPFQSVSRFCHTRALCGILSAAHSLSFGLSVWQSHTSTYSLTSARAHTHTCKKIDRDSNREIDLDKHTFTLTYSRTNTLSHIRVTKCMCVYLNM